MGALNADSKRFLDAAFGSSDKAWLVRGHYDASDKLVVLQEGLAGSFDLPDEDDLYYCVGTVTGSRKMVERVQMLVIDDVGKEIDREEFEMFCPLEPSFRRESSAGSFQVGFLIAGGEAPEAFDARRAAMKAHPVWGKAHNISAAAIYRLPQGTHTKSTRGGWKVCEESWSGKAYTPGELDALIPAGVAKVVGKAPKAFEWTLGDKALQALVDLIPHPPTTDRETWIRVMHGVKGAGGTFDTWDSWSSRWDHYDAADTLRAWETATNEPRAGGGRLREMAEAADPFGFDLWKSEWEVKGVFDDGLVEEAATEQLMVEAHQLNVADEIVRRFGETIRFNVNTGLWHQFNGSVWKPTEARLGFQYAAMWARTAAPALGKGLSAAVRKAGFFEGVEKILREEPRVTAREEDFDRDPWLLGTPGGTVDLRTGVLRRALAGDMISKCCLVTPSENEDCPVWKTRLIGWMTTVGGKADLEMRRFLQQWAGYCLSGDASEEKLLFLYGDGSNGKGCYVETLSNVMGSYYVEPATDLFMAKKHTRHQQEIAALSGARMTATTEVPPTGDWDEMLLKKVTGGGTMSANYMRQNQFTFAIRFKVTISGNDKPTFAGRISQAIRRRFMLATFPNKAAPVDHLFKPGLMKEAPGVLRWAINGAVDMQAHGGLLVPVSVQDATDRYLDDEDLFGGWVKSRTGKMAGAETGSSDLMADWLEHRNREGNHTLIDSHRKFAEEMGRHGFFVKHTMKGNVYSDIILKSKVNPF